MVAFTGRCLVHRRRDPCSSTARGPTRSRRRAEQASASSRRETGRRARLLPAGRALRLQGDFGARRGGVPEGERVRVGAAAGPRPAAPGARAHRTQPSRRSTRRVGSDDAARPGATSARLRRDHARGGGRRLRPSRLCGARADRDRVRERDAGCDGRARARRGAPRGREQPRDALVALRRSGESRMARSSTRRTRSRGRAFSWGRMPSARRRRDGQVWSTTRRASIFERLGAKPDLCTARGSRRRERTGSRAASLKSSGSSRLARRIAQIAAALRHQRAHGRAARPEHLREARTLVAGRGDGVRLRARPRRSAPWSGMTTARRLRNWWIRAMSRRRPTYRRAKREEAEMATESYDTVIVGGGQAGLATGYHLAASAAGRS